MVEKTVDEVVAKWGKRLKASTEEIKQGVNRVTEAPSAKAIAKKDKMLAKLIESIEDGTWEAQLGDYGLADWKKDMLEKGIKRISGGVDGATPKMKKFVAWLLSRVSEGQAKIADMPDMTLDDNLSRMETYIRHMAEQKFKKQ